MRLAVELYEDDCETIVVRGGAIGLPAGRPIALPVHIGHLGCDHPECGGNVRRVEAG